MAQWRYGVEDGIGWFSFERPEARNALTYEMYEGLRDVCRDVPTDGSVRALVVTGSGGAFAAGTDMALFRSFATAEDAWTYEARMEAVFAAIERCPVPTIAAIDGACTGGGATIAAACDLRLATGRLKFGVPIARTLGNGLSTANLARLARVLGPVRTRDILLTARLIEADEALAIGLVREVVADADALVARTRDLARQLASHAPLTLRATKEGLRRLEAAAATVDDRDLIAQCYTSADFKEGIDAFLAKRKPVWRGA
ncbi:MAG: enoyl-CoA hydratase/isomerase family protein [Alphaproteobacteria bacterium]